MENNYFISALTNYVDSLPNKKDAYYTDSNYINYLTLVNLLVDWHYGAFKKSSNF